MAILDEPDRWVVEWSTGWVSGKRVTLTNPTTEQQARGRDWEDWDLALTRAVVEVEREGDLVSEIEEYLGAD